MNTAQLLSELEQLGVVLTPRGDRLLVDAPAGAVRDELRQAIRADKTIAEAVRKQALKWAEDFWEAK